MIRLLLDQGLPRSSAALLRSQGLDTLHVGECGLASATDAEILAWARQENRTIVTLDADFHTLLALSGASHPSVVRIRIEGLKGPEMAQLTKNIVMRAQAHLMGGAMVVVKEDGNLRIKRLPILRLID